MKPYRVSGLAHDGKFKPLQIEVTVEANSRDDALMNALATRPGLVGWTTGPWTRLLPDGVWRLDSTGGR